MAKQPEKSKSTTKTVSRSASPQGGTRAAARRQERESERRRQRLITGAIIAGAVILAAIFVFAIVTAPAEAPIPPESLARYEGLQQLRTQDGFPLLGAQDAPVKVVIYSSFDCPHCREFHDQSIDAIVERVRDGKINFTYVPLYGFGAVTNGQGAAEAAMCVAQQREFWKFQDALFDWQGRYGNQAFTNNRILSGVEALGLNRANYNGCVASGAENDTLNTARVEQQRLLNFSGTPTITINGVVPLDQNQQPISASADVIARIDEEIARISAVPEATAEATAETTPEATREATEAAIDEAMPDATVEATEATPESTPAS